MAVEREHPAASLNGIEHQPSKLRGAGSSSAAVARPNEPKKKRPGGRWVSKQFRALRPTMAAIGHELSAGLDD